MRSNGYRVVCVMTCAIISQGPVGREIAVFVLAVGIALAVGFLLTFALTWVGLKLFPQFVSEERKAGVYREDRAEGGRLPSVGGPAMVLAITMVMIPLALVRHWGWEQTAALVGSLWLFGAVGFGDDLSKRVRGQGLGENAKWAGVGLASLLVAFLLYWRLGSDQPYAPYANWAVLQNSVGWGIFFFLLAWVVMAASSLSSNMSDGLDGLTGGLVLVAAVAFFVIAVAQSNSLLAVFCAGLVGAVAGFIVWNLPSNWTRMGSVPRRAKAYLGDSGALALGGALAVAALLCQSELLWFIIGGVFVLEGGSALIQTRILTKLFRAFLGLPRYAGVNAFVPHTEFPLPFRATPLHHHFDLLKLPRTTTIYGFWLAGLVFGLLGVAIYLAGASWARVILVLLALSGMAAIWALGMWTRSCFLGFWPDVGGDRRLALYYGKPYRLGRWKLYGVQELTELTETSTVGLPLAGLLWNTFAVSDAYGLLGYLQYERNDYAQAVSWWGKIDPSSLQVRPHILMLFEDALYRSQGGGR